MMEKEEKKAYDRRIKERNETNWKEKTWHGKFPRSIVDFADSVSWQWLRHILYVKKNTEAIVTAAQNQALRRNWIKANIDRADCSPYVECATLLISRLCTLHLDADN